MFIAAQPQGSVQYARGHADLSDFMVVVHLKSNRHLHISQPGAHNTALNQNFGGFIKMAFIHPCLRLITG